MISETIINTSAFPEILFKLITTEKVLIKEANGVIQLIPVYENTDCTVGLRGLLADCDDMSVDSFLRRKLADKELDL